MQSALVGRDQELAALVGWLDGSFPDRGRLVLVTGEAGIGKSRLMASFADQARVAGHRVLWGRTTEQDGAPPYWPWLQVLDPLDDRALLEAPSGPDPDSERFARFEAVSTALSAIATTPLLVVLEDMHHADPGSLRLLVHAAERLSRASILLVVTFRPSPLDHAPGFAAALDELVRVPTTQRLALNGLDAAGVARLLGEEERTPVVDEVVAMSGGNPLYVGELAHHLEAGGDLATVPRSIRDLVWARLVKRSAGCVDAVQVGAVVGRTFAAGLVATATGRAALNCLDDLDEAVGAGLIEPTGTPGEFRFVHAVVRDAVEASLSAAELPARHQQVAEAIEAYEGTGDEQASALARHRDAASALGDRELAARWCERAAAVADTRLAWEEAARLFDRAAELSGPSADPVERHRRMLGSARARLHCDEIGEVIDRCLSAADAGRRAGRPDLIAEATLVPEGRALANPALRNLALEALDGLPVDDHGRRARLHGQLTHFGFYIDPTTMAGHCEQAAREAAQAGDPVADLAAIRARHVVLYGPEHASERLDLAARLGRAARAVGRPSIALWEPLWRIDALVELGRVADAVASLPDLRRAVDAAGAPIGRWHLARVEAALAQAAGRFTECLAHAREARRLFALLEDPVAAEPMYLGFRIAVEMHAGWTHDLAERWKHVDLSLAPRFIGELPLLGPTQTAAGVGDLERARASYDRLSPAAGWDAPPALWLQLHAVRIHAAALLGVRADLPPLLAALEPHRGRHVGTGGGVLNYLGPVELWLGIGAAALERWDDANRDLATAGDQARASGTPGFAVHADVERATALLARRAPGDTQVVRTLLEQARPVAMRLGMPEFLRRIDAVLAGPTADGLLSPRELEVAALVAEGQTNKEIATELYLSERTAQNHVQHILTKLGVANRTQVAAWYREHAVRQGAERSAR